MAFPKSFPTQAGTGAAYSNTLTGNLVLQAGSAPWQFFTPQSAGLAVVLPSTTGVQPSNSPIFNLVNQGSVPAPVSSSTGTLLGFVLPQQTVAVYLVGASTWKLVSGDRGQDGGLAFWGGYGEYQTSQPSLMATCQMGANYGIGFMINSSSNTIAMSYAASDGFVDFSASATMDVNATLSGANYTFFDIVPLTATTAIAIWAASSSAIQALVLTWNGTSFSWSGTSTQVGTGGTYSTGICIEALSATQVFITYTSGGNFYCNTLSISGTTITVNTNVQVASGNHYLARAVALTPTLVHLYYNTTYSSTLYVVRITINGTSAPTVGTPTSLRTQPSLMPPAVMQISSTLSICFCLTSSANLYAEAVTDTGSAISVAETLLPLPVSTGIVLSPLAWFYNQQTKTSCFIMPANTQSVNGDNPFALILKYNINTGSFAWGPIVPFPYGSSMMLINNSNLQFQQTRLYQGNGSFMFPQYAYLRGTANYPVSLFPFTLV